jgi:hypothetical protein
MTTGVMLSKEAAMHDTLHAGWLGVAIAVGTLVPASMIQSPGTCTTSTGAGCEKPRGGFYQRYDQVPEQLKTPPGFYWTYEEVPAKFKRDLGSCLADGVTPRARKAPKATEATLDSK